MPDVIIVALISLAGTAFGSIAGIMTANKMTVYRIDQLEKKVDKHNNLMEKVALLQQETDMQWKSIDEIKDIIDEIRKEFEK